MGHKSSLFSTAPFLKAKQTYFNSTGEICKIHGQDSPDKSPINRVDVISMSGWWPHRIPQQSSAGENLQSDIRTGCRALAGSQEE